MFKREHVVVAALAAVGIGPSDIAFGQELAVPNAGRNCPSEIEYEHTFQYRVGSRAIFHMSGTAVDSGDREGTAYFEAVEMPNGEIFEHFYYPERVSDLQYDGKPKSLSVRGGKRTDAPVRGQMAVGWAGDGRVNDVTAEDLAAFEQHLLDAVQFPDIGFYIDFGWGCGTNWSFIIDFGVEIEDDNADRDDRGELLYFERGACSGNSHLVLQAVDADGAPLGPELCIGASETIPTTPRTVVMQEFGCAAIDLSRLGVERARYIKVMAAKPGVGGFIYGEQNPDFKIMAVYTTEPDPERVRRVMPESIFD